MKKSLLKGAIAVCAYVCLAGDGLLEPAFRPKGHNAWDFWFTKDQDTYHAFYLEYPDKEAFPDQSRRHGGQWVGHAASKDLVHWEERPTALKEAPARGIATGSCVRDGDRWCMLMTYQGFTLAESDDLEHWRWKAKATFPADLKAVWKGEKLGFRILADPYVYPEKIDGWWYATINSQIVGALKETSGAQVMMRSKDLLRWETHNVICYPKCFERIETAQIWEKNGRWYLHFGGAGGKGGSHIYMADRFDGPYEERPWSAMRLPCIGSFYLGKRVVAPDGSDVFLAGQGYAGISLPIHMTYRPDGEIVFGAEKVFADFEVTADKRWLLLPVKNGGTKCKMEVRDGARVLRFFDIELAEGEPDWWAPLDLNALGGRALPAGTRLTLWADKLPAGSKGLENVRSAVEAYPNNEGLYREKLRPQLHFSPRRGWNNDPNGLVFFNGEYHLFFQHNPYGVNWGNMHWGHAVSKDLVHWTEVDEALYPDALGPMFSGSAVVDHQNTSGFGNGGNPPLVLIYTAAGNPATQCMAWSLDGRTFTKYEGNPVVKNITGGNRDPKVFWHAPTRRWIMALYVQRPEKLHTVQLLSSPNLREWTALSAVNGDADGGRYLYECPDLFELPVAGSAERRWVLFGADGQYAVGAFDGVTFKPVAERLKGHCGTAAYAAQTFSGMPDGRRVLIGWLQAPAPGMPFNQCLSLPQELGLVNTPEGVRLTHAPVKELNALRDLTRSFGPADLAAGGANPLAGFEAELVELRLACEVSADAVINLSLRGVPLRYNASKQELTLAGHTSPWPVKDGTLGLIVYLDRTCVEVFSQDGLHYAPVAVIPEEAARKATLAVEKGSAKAVRGEVYALRTCWK